MLGLHVCTIVLGSPTYLLNSGSFSRSSRAEWHVIRVRSNCVISSGRVLPIWFSASQVHSAAQPLPHLISVIPFIFLPALPRLAYRFWSSCLSFPQSWNTDVGTRPAFLPLSHTKESKWASYWCPSFGSKLQEQCAHCLATPELLVCLALSRVWHQHALQTSYLMPQWSLSTGSCCFSVSFEKGLWYYTVQTDIKLAIFLFHVGISSVSHHTQTESCFFFFFNIFLFSLCVCAHAGYTSQPMEVGRGCQIPWHWSYRQLWAIWYGCWEQNSH